MLARLAVFCLICGATILSSTRFLAFFTLESAIAVVGSVIAVAFMSYQADELRKAQDAIKGIEFREQWIRSRGGDTSSFDESGFMSYQSIYPDQSPRNSVQHPETTMLIPRGRSSLAEQPRVEH